MVNLVPIAFLNRGQDQHQVGAHGEVRRLIADHHGIEVFTERLQSGVNHLYGVAANGVHFGMKFQAQHAVAQVDQACPGVLLYFFFLGL